MRKKDNELPARSHDEQNTPAHLLGQHTCAAGTVEKKANAGGLPQLFQKHACDAGRSLVGVQHNLLVRTRVSWRCVPPSLAARIFEVA